MSAPRRTDLFIVSWNVNGIRARWSRLEELLGKEKPDVVCLQETRCPDSRLPVDALGELKYEIVHSSGERQRRGGVAIITRSSLSVGEPDFELHGSGALSAGRWLSVRVGDLIVCSVYVPAGSVGDQVNNAEKLRFLKTLSEHAREHRSENFLIVGDFNIAPEDQDVYEALWLKGAYKIDEPERSHLREVMRVGGLVDVYRNLHPNDPGFTMWQEREGHYARDYGLRIDLALASESILGRLKEASVNHHYRQGKRPSDHAPLFLRVARQAKGSRPGVGPRSSRAIPVREPMPRHIAPMLATASRVPPRTREWAVEVKWDGIRAIVYWQLGELRIESRNHKDLTVQYPELQGLGEQLGRREAILDGEIVAMDEQGLPSFGRLQQRMHLSNEGVIRRRATEVPATYVIFDLLYLDDKVTMNLPYRRRRELLEGLRLDGVAWQTPAYFTGESSDFLSASAGYGLEGIVAKRLDGLYLPGRRTGDWLKVKNVGRQEFLIGGWLTNKSTRGPQIGALLLGYYERQPDGENIFRYAGRVGSGLDNRQREDLAKRLIPFATHVSPFKGTQPPRDALFAAPRVIVEVEFANWTKDLMLRHPVYKGIRTDLDPREIVLEQASPGLPAPRPRSTGARGKRSDSQTDTSAAGKILYPEIGFSSDEMLDYYRAIADVLVSHLSGRGALVRSYPAGVTEPENSSTRDPIDDASELIDCAKQDGIEFHTALNRSEYPSIPTAMVFVLEPEESVDMRECCRVALWLRDVLKAVALEAFVKTSGTGELEVHVPLNTPIEYEQTRAFARAVAELLEERHPDEVVSRRGTEGHPGKVLLDWSLNDPAKKTICVYSLRGTHRPAVSTPLTWEEVEQALAARRSLELDGEPAVILERIRQNGDLFAALLGLEQSLPEP
ncbi:MAG TPA: non-homologous end-joining DNA ligase [Solirubrobacteraceae bacterium]